MTDHHDDEFQEDLGPSKSQIKREMHALQEVGKRMLDLSDEQLNSLPISDTLKAAIIESRRIRKHEARRRHLHYIGKVMRNEEDPEAIERGLDAFDSGSAEHTRRHHLAERWRDRMVAEGDSAVGEFIDYCPSADIQHLRNLARNAKRDAEKEKNTGQAKKLFRYLRECIDEVE
ncbi:ribosome biogenesis factor YjgA [Marinobacter szutsaonensis]